MSASASSLSRKERDALMRRDDFFNAAEKLFAEKGFHHTSIEDIAKQAEYGTGTVYRYFKTKDDLLIGLLGRKGELFNEVLKERLAAAPTQLEKVRTLVVMKAEFAREHRQFFEIYAAEMRPGGRIVQDCDCERLRELFDEVKALQEKTIADAIKAGELRKMNPKLLARALSAMANVLLQDWVTGESEESPEVIARFICELLLKGAGKAG